MKGENEEEGEVEGEGEGEGGERTTLSYLIFLHFIILFVDQVIFSLTDNTLLLTFLFFHFRFRLLVDYSSHRTY